MTNTLSSPHLPITTYYQHSLKRFVPVFGAALLSYNGKTAGYRESLGEVVDSSSTAINPTGACACLY